MEITTTNSSNLKIETAGALLNCANIRQPYDKTEPQSFNTMVSNHEDHSLTKLSSGIVDVRRSSNIYLTNDDRSLFTVLGPCGRQPITKHMSFGNAVSEHNLNMSFTTVSVGCSYYIVMCSYIDTISTLFF